MQRFVYMTGIAIWTWVLIACFACEHHHIPTFNERWQPVIDHPLKQLGLADCWYTCRIA